MAHDDSLTLYGADLSVEERRFIDSLVQDPEMNLAEAARQAGYDGPKASDYALRLLRRPAVAKALAAVHDDRRTRHKDIRDGCIQVLWQLATHDIKDLMRSGQLLPPDELPASVRSAVKGVKFGKFGWEYTLVDRAAILQLLLKHFGETDKKEAETAPTAEGTTVIFEVPR